MSLYLALSTNDVQKSLFPIIFLFCTCGNGIYMRCITNVEIFSRTKLRSKFCIVLNLHRTTGAICAQSEQLVLRTDEFIQYWRTPATRLLEHRKSCCECGWRASFSRVLNCCFPPALYTQNVHTRTPRSVVLCRWGWDWVEMFER